MSTLHYIKNLYSTISRKTIYYQGGNSFFLIIVIPQILILISCRKLVDIPQPINSITDEAVYSTDATAVATLTGLYVSMSQSFTGGFNGMESFVISTSLSADELYLSSDFGGFQSFFFRNALINSIHDGGNSWEPLYNYVYRCNAAIEGITSSHTLSEVVREQLLGEAYFLRAFYYFHLINLFGPVPLATNTDYTKNTILARSPESEVYQFIIADLKKAQELLSDQFLNNSVNGPTTERVRPNRWAATALLARVYLYTGDYSNASTQASILINNSALFNLLPLNQVFLKSSREAIWQLQPVNTFYNTQDARLFIIPPSGFTFLTPFYLNPSLINSFESGDQRRIPGNWIGERLIDTTHYYFSYKYKDNTYNPEIIPATGTQLMTEYQIVLRLSEQYLIRAESRAQQNDLAGAISDLDTIRSRAGLALIGITNPSISKDKLLETILHERRVELFTEWGHRWFDLKRTGKVDSVMSLETPLKGGVWETREKLYPIRGSELSRAPNLTQNPGYPGL